MNKVLLSLALGFGGIISVFLLFEMFRHFGDFLDTLSCKLPNWLFITVGLLIVSLLASAGIYVTMLF